VGHGRGRRRHTTITPPPPSGAPGEFFGPTGSGSLATRVQAVRDETSPLAVVHPGGSPTVVNPGDSVNAKISAAGAGGTLWFLKGTHSVTSAVAPLAGQTWVLESAAGYGRSSSDSAVIDGGSSASDQIAWVNVADLTIKGGVWQNQGSASSGAGAAPIQCTSSALRLLVTDAILKNNYQLGLSFGANNSVARRCYITNNGRMGFAGGGGTDSLLDACRISLNNTRGIDPGASGTEAGTMKIAGATDRFIVQRCWAHDNTGFGPWVDVVSHGGYQYLENVVEHNIFAGLFMENVQGGCRMYRNFSYNNGYDTTGIGTVPHAFENKTQVRITGADSSAGTGVRGDVSYNVFDYDLTIDSIRGGLLLLWNHTAALPDTKNWDVHTNQFWLRDATQTQRLGGEDTDTDEVNQIWNGDNDFYDNEYHVASSSVNYWKWDSGSGDGVAKSYTQWQALHTGETRALI
jgi:hypothetical protein